MREAIGRLGALYEEERRLPELLALRQEELSRTLEVERRLALRLELDKIAATLEERSGRLEVLRANLEEQPGHWPTIETLARLLESRHRHNELVDLLTDQATRVEERGDRPAAGRMWDWIARLLVKPLGERDRAIRAYERVAELEPSPATFESLGRLWLAKGEPLRAAAWLERWQAAAELPFRTQAALELAGAYLKGDKRQAAVACLERALADAPAAEDVRRKLLELHRAGEAWEPLVRVLGDGAVHAREPETILGYAREAAEIAQEKLSAPHTALAALERAVALSPQDSPLRSHYAEALFAAGELGQARALLEALIQESGRRRSRERASLHLRVARVARAENKPAEALEHLEQAAEMDMDSAATLETLAGVAEEVGEHERAERGYRALMLLIRRGGKGASLSATEALLRLRQIALHRGQEDKAQDLLDSAIAEAIGSSDEARRLGKTLREQGSLDLLGVVLEKRLAATTDPGRAGRHPDRAGRDRLRSGASRARPGDGPGGAERGAGRRGHPRGGPENHPRGGRRRPLRRRAGGAGLREAPLGRGPAAGHLAVRGGGGAARRGAGPQGGGRGLWPCGPAGRRRRGSHRAGSLRPGGAGRCAGRHRRAGQSDQAAGPAGQAGHPRRGAGRGPLSSGPGAAAGQGVGRAGAGGALLGARGLERHRAGLRHRARGQGGRRRPGPGAAALRARGPRLQGRRHVARLLRAARGAGQRQPRAGQGGD